jgi:hypothetical protein
MSQSNHADRATIGRHAALVRRAAVGALHGHRQIALLWLPNSMT